MFEHPSGWKTYRFGEVASFRNGLNYSVDPTGQNVKIVTVADFMSNEVITDFSQIESISLNRRMTEDDWLEDGDLLFVRSNGNKALIGRCMLVFPGFEQVSFSGFTIRARLDKNVVEPLFLAHVMRSESFKRNLHMYGGGSSISNLSQDILMDFEVLLPPLTEQRKIAGILQMWDESNDSFIRLIELKRMLQGALAEKTIKKSSDKYVQLGEICDFRSGSGFKEIYQGNTSGEYPFIKVSDMNLPENSKFITHSKNWVNDDDLKAMKARLIPENAVVFAKVGAALKLNRKRLLIRPTAIDNNMMAAIANKEVLDPEFLYYFLQTQDLARFTQEGAVPSINQMHLSSIQIPLPVIEKQRKIAKMLRTLDDEIGLLTRAQDLRDTQKRGLMKRLLISSGA